MVKYIITLTEEERQELLVLSKKGSHRSQKVLNALILLNSDESRGGKKVTNEQISQVLQISMRKIDRVRQRFVEEGFETALNGHPKEREYKNKVDGDLEARLIAISCSAVPKGFSRWSLRMLADKAVELKYVESLSHETVRRILKKTNYVRGKSKDG
jgi:hypothetical protein